MTVAQSAPGCIRLPSSAVSAFQQSRKGRRDLETLQLFCVRRRRRQLCALDAGARRPRGRLLAASTAALPALRLRPVVPATRVSDAKPLSLRRDAAVSLISASASRACASASRGFAPRARCASASASGAPLLRPARPCGCRDPARTCIWPASTKAPLRNGSDTTRPEVSARDRPAAAPRSGRARSRRCRYPRAVDVHRDDADPGSSSPPTRGRAAAILCRLGFGRISCTGARQAIAFENEALNQQRRPHCGQDRKKSASLRSRSSSAPARRAQQAGRTGFIRISYTLNYAVQIIFSRLAAARRFGLRAPWPGAEVDALRGGNRSNARQEPRARERHQTVSSTR